jgi:VWFA-related protein
MQTGNRGAPWGVALIVLLALAVDANGLAGQSSGVASSPAAPAGDTTWPEVNLNIVVTDKHGTTHTIDERGFRLFEDGVERPLHFPDAADSPVSLALLIDSSGSIFKRRPEILSTVKTIIQALPADSEVMGVLFAKDAYIDLPFTPISQVDYSFLDRLQASGPTALYDAVYAAEDYVVGHAKNARRSMVILSDGQDNASHLSIRNVFWSMEQPGAPVVYACVTSKANIMQSELMAGHINMRFLAERGGGMEFNLDPDPASTAARIVAAVRSQHVLQFTAANPARNGKAHKLEVRLPAKDVEIHGLPTYHAPGK